MNEQTIISQQLRDRADFLCKTMEELTKYDPREKTRKRVAVIPRMMVCYELYLEGYTQTAIGIVMGKDHSTIHSYLTKIRDILTLPGYQAERELYMKLKSERQ